MSNSPLQVFPRFTQYSAVREVLRIVRPHGQVANIVLVKSPEAIPFGLHGELMCSHDSTIAIAATFTAEPIEPSPTFRMRELGISVKVEFARRAPRKRVVLDYDFAIWLLAVRTRADTRRSAVWNPAR